MPLPSRRDEILDHATRRATKLGLEALSIGQLAKDLEMSKSGLFSHFVSKEGLQLCVLENTAERFTREAIRPALKAPRGEPRLQAFFDLWLTWFIDNPFGWGCLFAAAASEVDDRTGPLRDQVAGYQKGLGELVANITKTGITEGHFRPDVDPEQVVYDLKGIMLAYQHGARLLHDPKSEDRARYAFARVLDQIRI
jgi:AcrR family transcriptional regulator